MMYLTLVLVLLASLFGAEGCYCPENWSPKAEICGNNGVIYKNRCVFECTQREFRRRGETLTLSQLGKCPKTYG
ncbi:uncharacterized protein Dana_GF27011 [Drosophila ananassae]|uniref:Kazal-like domain-containing protein n=1 Tax=Drosophila ananassae TaxID=7217 RepID=A0A0P8ZI15_DROAN|nr:uncharacterized protein LOC123257393 [Drosophila ananassae]KPU74349.1 uncharacterized protein Dana_GF27011 [Drosophila ananassae]